MPGRGVTWESLRAFPNGAAATTLAHSVRFTALGGGGFAGRLTPISLKEQEAFMSHWEGDLHKCWCVNVCSVREVTDVGSLVLGGEGPHVLHCRSVRPVLTPGHSQPLSCPHPMVGHQRAVGFRERSILSETSL